MDIRDLIQKADAYGKQSEQSQKQVEEGLIDWFKDVLGLNDEEAEQATNAAASAGANPSTTPPENPAAARSGTGVSPDAAGETQPNTPPPGTSTTTQGNTVGQTDPANQKDLMTRYNEGGKQAMPEIEKLQQDLKDLGFDPNGVDGKYGNGTFKAVQEFQKANGLQVDGQAGNATLAKIDQVKAGGAQAGGTGATASGDQGDGTRGSDTAQANPTQPQGNQPDAETQRLIDELNDLINQMMPGQTVNASANQDSIASMRGAINLAESFLREATEEQKAKLGELLAKLGDTDWASNNGDAYQTFVNKANAAMNSGQASTTPNATTAAAAGRADAADAGGATDAERAAGAGVDGPADATAAAAASDAGAGQTAGPDDGNRGGQQPNNLGPDGKRDGDDLGNAPTAPKVSKEVYIQMAPDRPADTTNFNVAKMKAKYPKPYVEIPNTDGTVTRGYGPEANLKDFVANKGKKLNAKIAGAGGASQNRVSGGTPSPTNTQPSTTQNQQPGTLAASKEYDMTKKVNEAASMNVTADNAAELSELLGILKNAGMPDAAPVADMHVPEPQGPMPCATCGGDHDADSPCGGGEEWDNSPDEGYGDMMDIIKLSGGPNSNKNPGDIRIKDPRQNDEEVEEDGWDNSPDEEYKDDDYMYQSGGIHKKKKSHPPVAGGDNPMALENSIKAQLYKALEEKLQNK